MNSAIVIKGKLLCTLEFSYFVANYYKRDLFYETVVLWFQEKQFLKQICIFLIAKQLILSQAKASRQAIDKLCRLLRFTRLRRQW